MGTRTRLGIILLLLFTLTGWAQNIRVTSLTATTAITNNGQFVTPAGAGNLKIWTSDANGVGSWQAAGSAVDTNALARLNGLGTNTSINGLTVHGGGFTNLVATTNAGPVNNAAAVTNHSTLRQIGAATFSGTITAFGANLFNGNTAIGEATLKNGLFLQGDVNTPQITSDQNNYNPAEGTNAVWRLWSDAERNITGIATAFNPFSSDGRVLMLMNTGVFNIVLVDESTSSAETNRFAIPGNIKIGPEESAVVHYDTWITRWRLLALGKAASSGDITGGNANQFDENAGVLNIKSGALQTNVTSRGLTNLSGPVFFASTADSFIVGDDTAFLSTVDLNQGFTAFGSSSSTVNSPLVVNGSFNMTPITNTALTVNQATNAYQRYTTNADFTVTFTGTALDGARGQFDVVNTGATNITVTWPLSYSVAQGSTFTTFTAKSNSITEVYWRKVSGTNIASVATKEIIENFTSPTAGQVVGFHDAHTKTNLTVGSLTDGDKGDITVGSSGAAWAIDAQNSAFWAGKVTDETGTGGLVLSNAPSLNNPTLVTPTIASFANANHNHQNSAGGGTLDAAAIAAGTLATARLGSGTANSTTFLRGDQTWATPAGGGDATLAGAQTFTGPKTFNALTTNRADVWIMGTEGTGLQVGDESGQTNFFGATQFGTVVGNSLALKLANSDFLTFSTVTETIIPVGSNVVTLGSATGTYSNAFLGRVTLPTSADVPVPPSGRVSLINTNNKVHALKSDGTLIDLELGGAGGGDVSGPASSQDNEVPIFSGAGGKTLKNSAVLIDGGGGRINAGIFNGTTGVLSSAFVTTVINETLYSSAFAGLKEVRVTNNVEYVSALTNSASQGTNFTADYTWAVRHFNMTNDVWLSAVANVPGTNLFKPWLLVGRNTSGTARRVGVASGFRRSGTNNVSVPVGAHFHLAVAPDLSGGVDNTNHTAQIILFDSP